MVSSVKVNGINDGMIRICERISQRLLHQEENSNHHSESKVSGSSCCNSDLNNGNNGTYAIKLINILWPVTNSINQELSACFISLINNIELLYDGSKS